MKLQLVIVALASLTFSACTSPNFVLGSTPEASQRVTKTTYEQPTQKKQEAFSIEKRKVGLSTKSDTNYKSFSAKLNTVEKKEWFNNLMYRLWDRQITRNQFISDGVAKLPENHYEFTFIANGFQKHS